MFVVFAQYDLQHIADGRSRGRRDDPDPPGEQGQGALLRRVEEPFFEEFFLEQLELDLEEAETFYLDLVGEEPVFAPLSRRGRSAPCI